jgi:alkyl sulfatase BDS1-like metallo-beta-lactamase superfamily hydrolase
LGLGAECGTWRNAYLAGATELRSGSFGTPTTPSPDFMGALTVTQVLDSVAVRVDGPRAWEHHLRIAWSITDEGAIHLAELRNGALHHHVVGDVPSGVTTFGLTRLALIGLVTGHLDPIAAIDDGTVHVDGDPGVLGRLVGVLAPVDPDFAIVTP